jgi:glycosyltransferase involved in cell wall biosynthesis
VTGAEEWKNRLVAQGIKSEHITVVHSGVEDRFFQDYPALLPLSTKLTAGFFAKMDSNESDRKGTRHFLHLADYICQNNLQNRFRFVISGTGWEDQVTTLQTMGIETVYLPYVEAQEMPALYRSLDVYLMLSDVEGGPVTIAEAMASGCLVFSTHIGVARDIIEDGMTGLLVKNTDLAGILDRLLYFQAHPEQSQAIRKRARLLASDRMRYDQTLAPLGRLYREVFNLNTQLGEGYLDPERENKVTARYSAKVKP